MYAIYIYIYIYIHKYTDARNFWIVLIYTFVPGVVAFHPSAKEARQDLMSNAKPMRKSGMWIGRRKCLVGLGFFSLLVFIFISWFFQTKHVA